MSVYFVGCRRNIKLDADKNYLKSCKYHPHTDPLCPIFSLGDAVAFAGESFEKLAYKVCQHLMKSIQDIILWEFNLDWNDHIIMAVYVL